MDTTTVKETLVSVLSLFAQKWMLPTFHWIHVHGYYIFLTSKLFLVFHLLRFATVIVNIKMV
jgi:hypothetical protein